MVLKICINDRGYISDTKIGSDGLKIYFYPKEKLLKSNQRNILSNYKKYVFEPSNFIYETL